VAGESGQAGKSGGSTDPQEPIVTLSVSNGRQLQWCVYPTDTGDSANADGDSVLRMRFGEAVHELELTLYAVPPEQPAPGGTVEVRR